MEPGPLGGELYEHGYGPVALRSGPCDQPVGDLPLKHHAPSLDARQTVETLDAERGCDRVRQVCDELPGRWGELGERQPHRVPEHEVDVRCAGEGRTQRSFESAVELDRVNETGPSSEVAGESAQAGSHLENDVAGVDVSQAADYVEDVLVDQKVLSEVTIRGDFEIRHDRLNARAALASTVSTSSGSDSPRASASAPSTSLTFAGSFGVPRTRCGAR